MKASEVEPKASPGALKASERKRLLRELPSGYVRVSMDLLAPAELNPRRGAVAQVVESLREFGQHRPVVVQRKTGQVIVGNHLFKAAQQLGWEEIDAYVVDDDDRKALRRAVADNATGDSAEWDERELAQVLAITGGVPGFEDDAVDKLLEKLRKQDEGAQPTYPIVPVLNEKYDYVLVFAQSETDWVWLQTVLELRPERSYRSTHVSRSHIVTVERLQALLGEKAGADPDDE